MITDDVTTHENYFLQKRNALGKLGLHPIQKVASALRMLAYGGAADANDEYIQIAESTSLKSLMRFCEAVIAIYSAEYLRHPTEDGIRRLHGVGEARGFPGMLGSLDCMHWEWKNCPTGWAGQYTGKEKASSPFSVCFKLIILLLRCCVGSNPGS